MKVAYLFSRYPVPSQTFCDTEIRALEDRGVEVEIYSCSPPSTSFRHGAAGRPHARVFHAPPRLVLDAWEAAAKEQGSWPAATIAAHEARFGERYDPAQRARHAIYFANLIARRGVDHLHVHFANRATHAALFVAELCGIPFSFTAHAQDFLVDLGSDDLLCEMCARAAFVVAVSDFSRAILAAKCPASAAKIHRIYNGQLPVPGPTAAPPGVGPGRILSVGRLIEFKGFLPLIAACGILKASGVNFRCRIAGDGPLRPELERAIADQGLAAEVELLGLLAQEDIRQELAACDVFALACLVDSKGACDVLPTVILEAMAAGKPVVSTRLAGIPEMVADGLTGTLVGPGDAHALAAALADLLADPAKRGRYGAAGRERVRAHFSAEDSARQLASLFAASAVQRPAPAGAKGPGSGVLCLLAQWPGDPASCAVEDAVALSADLPGARIVHLNPRAPLPANPPFDLLKSLEPLPDAIVLEADWREQPALAHRIEAWREMLGGYDTTQYLVHARRALWLHLRCRGEPLRHLHAVGYGALVCAWILQKLTGVTASFSLYQRDEPVNVRRVAADFAGGRLSEDRKLAAALGPGFELTPPDAAMPHGQWAAQLRRWASL